jgi:hypothetical protein
MLTGREAVADEIKAWSVNFSKRAESRDVGAVRLALRGVKDSDEGRETFEKAIAAGFAGHPTPTASKPPLGEGRSSWGSQSAATSICARC